ncbi:hypothetical protein PJW08_07510 [Tenacibaculum finnmarkense]|nr:hypothetical protein PJW08_07510 [Tenacibaculum finnmarkense]
MNLLNTDFLEENYLTTIKQRKISGRYITLNDIEPLYDDLDEDIASKKIGESEQGKAIYQLKLGSGKIKILIWSRMHGNESTRNKSSV